MVFTKQMRLSMPNVKRC